MRRKDKGILEHFLPAMVVIVLLGVIWTGSMICADTIDRSSEIQQAARACMLRMETDGYLTEANKNQLVSDLEALDVSGIDLSGTTVTDAGYGNQISLVIHGVVTLTDLEFTGFASPMLRNMQTEVSVRKVSVAKN